MDKLLFIEDGAMPQESIDKLEAKGYTIVHVNDTSKIKTISDIELINKDILYTAAIDTLNGISTPQAVLSNFAEKVLKMVKNQQTLKPCPPAPNIPAK